MKIEELNEIKNTYNNAGYFMLYVDEIGFDKKTQNKLLSDDIYAINDFDSKFIKDNYPATTEVFEELKTFLELVIQDLSNGVLSASGRGVDELLESFSELVKVDKTSFKNIKLERYQNANLLKTLFARYYAINEPDNKSELDAFLKFIDEKEKQFLSTKKSDC